MARNYFGNVRELPSRRWQARWKVGARYLSAKTDDGRPLTFTTERKARLWLSGHREAILAGTWSPVPPAASPEEVTLSGYAATWLASRALADRTRDH